MSTCVIYGKGPSFEGSYWPEWGDLPLMQLALNEAGWFVEVKVPGDKYMNKTL